jgi:hypothetical protein
METIASDTVLYEDGGSIVRRTGFRKIRANRTLQDIRFSPGQHCDLRLDSLIEFDGISLCRNRRGEPLPVRETGTPIDWNQNGVIDMQAVDLWGTAGEASVPWFLELTTGRPIFRSIRQFDRNDWVLWATTEKPFIGVVEKDAGTSTEFLVGEPAFRRDLKRVVSW